MLTDVEQRLDAIRVDGKSRFRLVDSALSLSSVLSKPINQSPVAYVVPVAERPGRNERTIGTAMQSLDITFGVVIALTNRNDPTGKRGNAVLQALRDEVRQALFGWSPNVEHHSILLGPGDLVSMDKNGIWWLDKFTTKTYKEANHA